MRRGWSNVIHILNKVFGQIVDKLCVVRDNKVVIIHWGCVDIIATTVNNNVLFIARDAIIDSLIDMIQLWLVCVASPPVASLLGFTQREQQQRQRKDGNND